MFPSFILTSLFLACEITINISSAQSEWKEKNLSGCYNMVETVNGRPAYKVSILLTLKRRQLCWLLKVDNGILMLTTSFKYWYPRSFKRIVDLGDQKGKNRHQLIILVTDTFCV